MEDDDVKCRFKLKRKIRDNTLRGEVQLVTNKVLEIKHAYIEITGFAACSFELDKIRIHFPTVYTEDTLVKGFEQFYYTRHTLCGDFGGNESTFQRGSEFYPFRCYWPSRLPGTWYGDHGCIEYLGRVTIRLKNPDFVYTHCQMIHVKYRRDLRLEPHLLNECRVDVARNFWTSRSIGTIYVSVWLPICGIAIGQALPVMCSIINNSKLHFGSIVFLLTRTDVYKSDTPIVAVKTVRTDICRVARMVSIHKGKFEYYAILQTDEDTVPTNQFFRCKSCEVFYEVWVSVQGAFARYRSYGYPNVDTPGIPVVIGTKPLRKYDIGLITADILKKMNEYSETPLIIDELPEDVQNIIQRTDEELNPLAIENLERQLQENEKLFSGLREESLQKPV